MLVDEAEREQRVPEMVEHAQKQHDVESLAERSNIVHREFMQIDLDSADLGGEAGLGEIVRVVIDAGPRRFISSA